MSYIHFHRIGAANILSINGPQVVNAVASQSNPTLPTFRTTQQGYPEGFADPAQFNPLTANFLYMPRDYHSSVVQSWYVSVQREIAKNMLIDVAYVGNRADDLLSLANYNQAVPNNAAGSLSLQSRRPIPEFSDITYSFNGGKSRYNALQLKYEYRMRRGFMFLSSFTWSKAKDNGAGSLEGAGPAPQNFYDLEENYGTSTYDQPYNSTTSVVWQLPFGQGRKWMSNAGPLLDAFIGGWTISGINTMTSGEPATLTYSPSAAFQVSGISQTSGANQHRANVNGDPHGDKSAIVGYLSTTTVTAPDQLEPASSGTQAATRCAARGSGRWTWSPPRSSRSRCGDQTRLQFRFEAFNLLNRANFRAPNANRNSANYGTITSTFDARQMQVGAKLSF
jgi:hypothetical protein